MSFQTKKEVTFNDIDRSRGVIEGYVVATNPGPHHIDIPILTMLREIDAYVDASFTHANVTSLRLVLELRAVEIREALKIQEEHKGIVEALKKRWESLREYTKTLETRCKLLSQGTELDC
jgi:hypothetical protein